MMMEVQKTTHSNTQQPGLLTAREVLAQLKEKNSDGEYKHTCIADSPRVPGENCRSVLHFGNPYEDRPVIISLPSRIAPEEARKILSGIVPIPEFCLLTEHLASAYQAKTLAIIEGETSVGKTLAVNTFTKLLYGEKAQPLDFYCVGQTDVSELMGKWVPQTGASGLEEEVKRLRSDPSGQELFKKLSSAGFGSPEFAAGMAALNNMLRLPAHTPWEYQLGAIPKAMCGGIDSHGLFYMPETPQGCVLHVQEIGLAKPAIVDAFLRLRGERSKLAGSIQLWEDSGRLINAGPDFFVVMTTNPPENYIDRNELDFALVRAAELLRIDKLSGESLNMIAKAVFTNALPGSGIDRPPFWGSDLSGARELGSELASFVALFHEKASEALKGGEPGRIQRIVPTLDHFDRVHSRFIREQILAEGRRGILEIDAPATIRRAVEKVYLAGLSSEKIKKQLTETLAQLLDQDLGKVQFRGTPTTRSAVFRTLAGEYLNSRIKEQNGQPRPAIDERMEAEISGLQAQARAKWNRLARSGVLPV